MSPKADVRILSEATAHTSEDQWFSPITEAVGDSGRVFAVEIVKAGTSKNRKHYPAAVLAEAAPLYEGMKAFDHHRSPAEVESSSVAGLVGHYRNVRWNPQSTAIEGELHLLPSAVHIAEAFTASLSAQAAGLSPLVGISHVVGADTKPRRENGRMIEEATRIAFVRSADVVAEPSAGGRVTHLVAGGPADDEEETPTPTPTKDPIMLTFKELMDKLRGASAEDQAKLLEEHAAVLTNAGYTADDVPTLLGAPAPAAVVEPATPAVEAKPEGDLVAAGAELSEAVYGRESLGGAAIIREAVSAANLPAALEQRVRARLPERFTEADVLDRVGLVREIAESTELADMKPKIAHIAKEDRDKRTDRLLATFRGDYQGGYATISEAYHDITGEAYMGREEFARKVVSESWQGPTWSGKTLSEAITTSQWGEVLADAMNRRIVEIFEGSWADWRKVSNIVPVSDFRSQKLIQVGEFASLPTVAEGGAYQPLTSPSDRQETYSPTKKGGTESFTYEAARNDDIRVLASIPTRLGRLVAFTIYNTVFAVFTANPTMADSVALFHATHGNTAAGTTLGNAGVSTLRGKMRDQAAYGDTTRALGLTPKYLIVPNELEDLANQICNGDRAVPSTTPGATDVPNLHKELEPIVVDVFTDANDYFLSCNPMDNPTIEVGFLDGKVDPELFLQDDPRNGTPFSSDEVTWKVRSIWGYAPADYRGLQRMTN